MNDFGESAMRKSVLLCAAFSLGIIASAAAQEQPTLSVPLWMEGQNQGGWEGNHNATVEKDPEGVILKAGKEGSYGAVFRGLGEIDLDRCPFFAVEVDKFEGEFGCKLTNNAKKDKQVIFSPSADTRFYMTHLPSQTGWSGKVSLSLGIYCHGAGKSLRVKKIEFLSKPTKEMMEKYDQIRNLLFNSSFELDAPGQAPMQTWHRIGSYLLSDTPWRIVEGDAFHGSKSALTIRPGKLLIQREIHGPGAGIYTFSVHMKAAKDGHKARLSVVTYKQGKPFATTTESKDVTAGKEWSRYYMTIDVPVIRNRGVLGATDLIVESLDEGELRLDAMQFELAQKPTMYGDNRSLLSYKRIADLRTPLYPQVVEPSGPVQPPACEMGTIKLAPLGGAMPPAEGWPMLGTVTLPQGVSYDIKTWRLKNPGAAYLPAQMRVLARWKGDGSIKAAEVIGEADGSKEWTLEYNSNVPAPSVENPLEIRGPISVGPVFSVTSVDGKPFSMPEKPATTRVEESGPIRAVVRIEGSHRSETGEELLSYVARLHAFHDRHLTRTEYTWVNTNASPTAMVSSIGFRVPLDSKEIRAIAFFGAEGKTHEIKPATLRLSSGSPRAIRGAAGGSILQCDENKKYFYEIRSGEGPPQRFEGKAEGRVRVDLGEKVLDLRVNDWWQDHPMEIAADKDGLTVYFWSPRVKASELTRGMAKTYIVDIWHGPKDKAPAIMAGPTQLVAPPSIYCLSGVFGGRILPSEGSPFLIFEKAVNSPRCRARMDPEVMLATDCYGQFNYGDCIGDGGWANQETQHDHAAWVHYLRTGDPRMFEVAQAGARHYRDVDIDQISGSTITHNPSHTLGGESTSHAWIQGTLDHYLATGERRSMEVALLHSDFLKSVPLEKLTTGGREVTRILDNFGDLYMLTGDDELIKKYHEIVAAQRENLKKGKTQFPGLFQHETDGQWAYPAGFPPWYGLYSMVKMRLATGDKSWEKALEEETRYAMAKLPFEYARPEFFSDNKLTDDQRIVRCMAEGTIGDRGCMLFPPLGYAYAWTKNKRYLDIGMTTTYIAIISREYQDPLFALAGVFLQQAREAGLGAEDEKRYYEEALDIMKGAARPRLSNPGFEEGAKDWKAWREKSTTSSFWRPVREKCMRPDTVIKKEGKQSLHVIIVRDCPPWGSGVGLGSELFVVGKGKSLVIEGWVRSKGDVKVGVALGLDPLSAELEPQSFTGSIGEPDADGWRRWKVEAKTEADSLARLSLNTSRADPKAEGEAWWDGITVGTSND
jgi:hypothetical protein